jgi:hypothetical protein
MGKSRLRRFFEHRSASAGYAPRAKSVVFAGCAARLTAERGRAGDHGVAKHSQRAAQRALINANNLVKVPACSGISL